MFALDILILFQPCLKNFCSRNISVCFTYWTQRLLVAMRLAALKGARRLALVVTRGRGVVDENANLEDFLYASAPAGDTVG